MASKTCCNCLRALRWQSRSGLQTPISTSRAFTTTRFLSTTLPEPNATSATSIPPVTPQRVEGGPKTTSSPSALRAAAELKRVTGRVTETYTVYGAAERLFKECAKQADYSIPQAADPDAEMPKTEDGEDLGVGNGWWHSELGLKPTFSTWSQVTMLHMYILIARIRCLPAAQVNTWQQHLLDHFFYAAENKMTIEHQMHARGTRNRYLKDLFIQWRGLLASYDEGLQKGDAVLAAAVWRNVFKADQLIDVRKLALVVAFMRRSMQALEAAGDDSIRLEGGLFANHAPEVAVVGARSRMMDLPFAADGKVGK